MDLALAVALIGVAGTVLTAALGIAGLVLSAHVQASHARRLATESRIDEQLLRVYADATQYIHLYVRHLNARVDDANPPRRYRTAPTDPATDPAPIESTLMLLAPTGVREAWTRFEVVRATLEAIAEEVQGRTAGRPNPVFTDQEGLVIQVRQAAEFLLEELRAAVDRS